MGRFYSERETLPIAGERIGVQKLSLLQHGFVDLTQLRLVTHGIPVGLNAGDQADNDCSGFFSA